MLTVFGALAELERENILLRVKDNYYNEEVSFKDVVIILTTNAGKNLYEDPSIVNLSAVPRKKILKALATDVDPRRGTPLFPAAICSRFASGNVVMFNRMAAHDLRHVARQEILRHAEKLQKTLGIDFEFDEGVFTAMLLGALMGCQQMIEGVCDLFRGRFTLNTMLLDECFQRYDGMPGDDTTALTIYMRTREQVRRHGASRALDLVRREVLR